MAKHDRRKSSGQASSSQPVTIQVPLPVLGVVNGVREALHGLCIATGLQVLEAMMEGTGRSCVARRGATKWSGRHGAAGARTGSARRAAGRGSTAAGAERRRQPTRWTSTRWPRSRPGCRRGDTRARWTRCRPT